MLVGIGTIAFIGSLLFARRPVFFSIVSASTRPRFTNVAGLNVGDEVRYGGVRVGSVTALDIDSAPPSTHSSSSCASGATTPVRADTRASITQLGLLGQPYLALEPGAERRASCSPRAR